MPARVHAFLVVRPDGRGPSDLHLSRTLRALSAQTRPPDLLTVVLCGPDEELRRLAADSGAEGVIVAPRGTGFAEALALATHRLEGDAVWLLAQDTAPAPDALARLAGALETAPSVAYAAPKLVRWDDPGRIVSLGVSMTRFGRTVGLADGELDQGQHDTGQDVLGADVRGVLVRADVWRTLGGLDAALAGADEGLDLGVRVRLAGGRVALAPTALVAVAGDGVAGTPDGRSPSSRGRRAFAERTAQLHRRLVYAPAVAVPLHWLTLLPLALLRSIAHLVAKRPGRIGPEWAAALLVMVRPAAVARARGRIRRARTSSWHRLAPLRVSARSLRQRLDDEEPLSVARTDLGFFTGGGAWVVLGALATSVLAFGSLLAWPALGGGALAPLRTGVLALWADTTYGARAVGWDAVGPADPFAAVVAVLGSLSPAAPSRALVILWVLALPLAALGAWFAATRVTERPLLRNTAAFAWAVAPGFLAALTQGQPTGVLVHLVLPWLLYTAAAARRSWTDAGLGSILLLIVVACAPSLAPALIVLWLVAVALTLGTGRAEGIGRVAWLVVPAVVVAVPLVVAQAGAGNLLGLLADPGVPADPRQVAPDAVGRILLTAGFPAVDAGWDGVFGGILPMWAIIVWTAPVIVLALLGPLLGRMLPALVCLLIALLGTLTAFAAAGLRLSHGIDGASALWTGSAVSLAWAGFLGAALVALDRPRFERALRPALAALVIVFLAVQAVPALSSVAAERSALRNGPDSTLPAYVQIEGERREGQGDDTGTVVLRPLRDGSFAATVVWGASDTLGGRSTLQHARVEATDADRELARLTADLVTPSTGDVVGILRDHGIAFVLLDTPAAESDAARAARLGAQTALNRRDDLVSVGATAKGMLWGVTGEVVPRAESADDAARAAVVAVVQAGVVVIALLLAVPTRASLRAARRYPRVIGAGRNA